MKSKTLLIVLTALLTLNLTARAQQTAPPSPPPAAEKQDAPVDSDTELRSAIERSGGSETQIVVNLEEYLKKFPKSAHRSEIENEIYKVSIKLRDRTRAISYGEKLLAGGENIDVLTSLVTTLRDRKSVV